MAWLFRKSFKSDIQLDGKTAIVTGANNGIGKATASDLAHRGATVIMACRNQETANSAAEEIRKTARGKVIVEKLDLASFNSIREFAKRVLDSHEKIHLLINNAANISRERVLTEDGYELGFATNHLGHFLLTHLLLEKIIESKPSRIINVSSSGHSYYNEFDLDDINMEKDYTGFKSYCKSKLANNLFTKELARRLEGTGVTTYCLNPGIVKTDLQTSAMKSFFSYDIENNIFIRGLRYVGGYFMLSHEQGAHTTLYCALDETLAAQSGLYYDNCQEKTPSNLTLDEQLAKDLWEKSVCLVNYCSPAVASEKNN